MNASTLFAAQASGRGPSPQVGDALHCVVTAGVQSLRHGNLLSSNL